MRPRKGLSLTVTLPNALRIVVPEAGVRWSLARMIHDERLLVHNSVEVFHE
jgi:hypothetical protein